jgi:AcrR family transcriptional regulator
LKVYTCKPSGLVYTCQTPRVAKSRDRILETAWALVRERGAGAATMAEIAAGAGVSRQMVYVHFGSRAGLLTATARDHDRRSGFVARVVATRDLPPVDGLEQLVREWLAYIPDILPVAHALEMTGDEGAAALRDRFADLHAAFAIAVARVDEAGRLAPGWTAARATDWAWARCHLTDWQHLVQERGWPPEEYAERTVASILAEVVSPSH